MLILPDRKLFRGSILMPVPRREWMPSSQAMEKDQLGNQNRQLWQITARLNDGHIVWRGTFEDRDEADAFLHALLWARMGGPPVPRELWDLPTPSWFPGLGELITYEFASPIIIVSGTSQTSPSDYNNSNNSWQALGGGASGGATSSGTVVATGGGGGEYRKITNFSVATPGTTAFNYTIGPGGTAVSTSGSNANGNDGTQTTFNTSSLIAKPGIKGAAGFQPQNGGAGGAGGTGAAANNNGGAGGNVSNTSSSSGGGAAGSAAATGGAGVNSSSSSPTAGGNSNTATGGAGGTTNGAAGGNGTDFDGTHGSGAGGGASTGSGGAATAGAGGNYGAGGGGARASAGNLGTSGAGIQGIIWGIYVPVSSRYSNFFLNF